MKYLTLIITTLICGQAMAQDYVIDTKDSHAFINFRVQHLGYSWLWGRFDDFSGSFSYDENQPNALSTEVSINTTSINTGHDRRDKHLRGGDFLEVSKYPEASFVSTSFTPGPDGGTLLGNLTLRGVSQEVEFDVKHIGHGPDPWGNNRRGFEATGKITMADFGIDFNLGPKSKDVEFIVSIEGIAQ